MKFFAGFNKHIRLRTKMLLLFGTLGFMIMLLSWLVSLYGVPLAGIEGTSCRVRERAEKQLQLVTAYKKELLKVWLVVNRHEIERFARHPVINRAVGGILQNRDALSQQRWLQNRIKYFVDSSLFQDGAIIVSQDKGVIARFGAGNLGAEAIEQALERAQDNPNQIVVDAYEAQDYADSGVCFACSIHPPGATGSQAVIITFSSMNHVIYNILQNTQGLGRGAAVLLLNARGQELWQFSDASAPHDGVTQTAVPQAPLWSSFNTSGLSGESIGVPVRLTDAHGGRITAVIQPVPVDDDTTWHLVVQQDDAEIHAAMLRHIRTAIVVGLMFIAPVLGVIFLISRQLTRPLQRFSHDATRVLQGDLQVRARPGNSTEEVQLARVFNSMVEHIASWQEELENQVAQKTAALNRAQQQRASVAALQECYLEQGKLAPTLDMLVEQLLEFTGADIGRFYRRNRPEEMYAQENTFVDTYTCATAPLQAYAEKSHGLISENIAATETSLLALAQAHLQRLEKNAEIILVDVAEVPGQMQSQALLVPVARAHTTFGLIVLLCFQGGFAEDVKDVAAMFASATALIMDADRRESARKAAEDAARLKGKFLANMSHELRTPMNVVIGMNGLLQETELDEKQRNYVGKIALSSRQLMTLINDILDASRFESGHKLSFRHQQFSIDEMLDDVVSLHVYSMDETKVEMHVDVASDVPRTLIGDRQRLEQILNNLVGNAVKFTERGDIVLRVELEQHNSKQATLLFQVRDSGIGISAAQQERMFMPFEQADMSSTRKYGGTGLGLTISMELCDMMGGGLWLESEEGKGSIFYVRMPFGIGADAGGKARDHAAYPDLENQRILLVDDNALGCRISAEILKHMHLRVDAVSTAASALSYVQHAVEAEDPYALVVADAIMPGMGGLSLAQKIHELLEAEAPKIVVLCPPRQYERYVSLDVAAIDALCVKPVRASALFDAISEAFGYPVVRCHGSYTQQAYMWQDARILLAEDNELNRQVAHDLLERVGIEVIDAANGAEAVQLTQEEDIDLILMDIQMPVMDGLEASRAIRALADVDKRRVPIVAMTAGAFEKDRNETSAAGMDEHISKPVDPLMLYAVLERILPQEKRYSSGIQGGLEPPLGRGVSSRFQDGTGSGLNMARGLCFASGDRHLYLRRLHGFADHFADFPQYLQRTLKDKSAFDAEQLLHMLHDLKSAAGTIGADGLQRNSAGLERELKRGEDAAVQDLLIEVQEQLRNVLEYCRAVQDEWGTTISASALLAQQEQPAPEEDGTGEAVGAILEQLVPALEQHRVHECKKLADRLHSAPVPGSILAEEIDKLRENIEKYRYEQALECARQIMNRRREKGLGNG